MKQRNLLCLLLAAILLCSLIAGCAPADNSGETPNADNGPAPMVGTAGSETVANACYLYTPRMTEDAFRYLDEIYIEKYPQLGLRWEHGTGADQRIVTNFTQQLTAGCTTDAEKVAAIYNWITTNIRYQDNTSPFSADVLYNGYGNCLGQAMLMQDMCRVLGIPAVFGDGFRGYMKTFSVEDMHRQFEGHAWVFVYLDGQWILYDPVWYVNGTTDRQFIEENYYIDTIGGITPIYDENYMPPFRTPDIVYAYMNGGFIGLEYGQPSDTGQGFFVNYCMSIGAVAHTDGKGFFYMDGPAAFTYAGGMKDYELYSNGWIAYGDSGFLFGDFLSYVYENGIQASETILERNGETFYMSGGIGYKLEMPDTAYRLIDGYLTVDANYQGTIWGPHAQILPEGDYTCTWITTDPSIATVDENGVVTCHKPGQVDIIFTITGVGYRGNEEYVYDEELNPWLTIYETGEDGLVVEKEYRGYSMSVQFSNDISRPAEYAALDTGGSVCIDSADLPRVATRDLYPIMTDDMLFMFDPVDGVVTLPTAQNANGYCILPDTYEAALKYPYDFKLPLTEGYLILDRETLKTFTLVDTGEWGEMWYLPLNEAGKDAWNPGSGEQPKPPSDVEFGNVGIPGEELMVDFLKDEDVVGNNPVLLPDHNGAMMFLSALQMAGEQNSGLGITFSSGTMTLDAATVQKLLSDPTAELAEFWMIRIQPEWCTFNQQGRLERMALDGLYYLYGALCVENVGNTDLTEGNITVTVPLTTSGGTYGVFFVDAYGNYFEVPSSVNGSSITFEAPYFSTYAIIDVAKTPVK